MAISHIGRLLRGKVEQKITKISDDLASGVAADWPSYRYFVGYIEGAKMVLEQLEAIEGEN